MSVLLAFHFIAERWEVGGGWWLVGEWDVKGGVGGRMMACSRH